MKLTKEKLLSLVKQNINEMPMDFNTPDRPSGDVQQKLQANDTPLTKVPFPKTNVANQNFQELLASERYQQVVQNVRNYTNYQGTLRGGMENLTPLLMMMGSAHNQIIQIERNHRERLEQLAVEIVKEEMGITDDDFNFDAKIIGQGEFDTSDFNKEREIEQNPQEVNVDDEEGQEEVEPEIMDIEEELYIDLSQLDLERAKRRLINSIIQGASEKGHYMYQLIPERIQQITGSDTLINLYGIMMSVNDANYWQLDDETIRSMGDSVAGKVKLNMPGGDGEEEGEEGENDGKPTIYARGINFPVLVHELIKGVLETLGVHGQKAGYNQTPQERQMFKKVSELEDTLEKEMWDLRLGPAIWDRIRVSFPEEVLLENGKELQNYLFMNVFQLPAKEFLVLMREVISNSEVGKNLLSNMLEGIKKMLNDEDYEDAMGQFNNDIEELSSQTDEDTLKNELKNLGIDFSDSEDDEESDEDFLNQFK
jgi:hypothetical protein